MNFKLIQKIKNKKRLYNSIFNYSLITQSICFSVIGMFSYLNIEKIVFLYTKEMQFFPQGMTISIYGLLGIIISILQTNNKLIKLGEGLNKIEREKITIVRKNLKRKKNLKIKFEIKNILRKKNILLKNN